MPMKQNLKINKHAQNVAVKRTKTASKKPIKDNENQTKGSAKTNENKTTKKLQVSQNTNPFVDRYLEFYDDIKIPSRRYDW